MLTSYHHLSSAKRAVIMLARQENQNMRSIARNLDRSVWTIRREIRRTDAALYDATRAAQGYAQRRGSAAAMRIPMACCAPVSAQGGRSV